MCVGGQHDVDTNRILMKQETRSLEFLTFILLSETCFPRRRDDEEEFNEDFLLFSQQIHQFM